MVAWVLRKLTQDEIQSHTDYSSVLTTSLILGLFSQPKWLFWKYNFFPKLIYQRIDVLRMYVDYFMSIFRQFESTFSGIPPHI